jgi:alpha-1,6-mannosyltransferase
MVGGGQMKDLVDGYVRTHPKIGTTPFLKNPAALAEWYQAADLLLHPGRWETFGLVLLEAQACGLPVIAFRGGAMDEQSYDVTHWATERSSEAFSLAVQKRMHRLDDNDRKPLISFIENNFSWDRTFARQLAEYES